MKTQQFQKALTFALPMEHFEQIKQITDEMPIPLKVTTDSGGY